MSAPEAVDLVVFDVGGTRYAADLGQVRRVDLDDPGESVGQPLGTPRKGGRALVFTVGEGYERRLAIDQVLGVSRVPLQSLRRMPRAVNAPPYSIGAWLDGDQAVLLIDLLATVPKESPHGH